MTKATELMSNTTDIGSRNSRVEGDSRPRPVIMTSENCAACAQHPTLNVGLGVQLVRTKKGARTCLAALQLFLIARTIIADKAR